MYVCMWKHQNAGSTAYQAVPVTLGVRQDQDSSNETRNLPPTRDDIKLSQTKSLLPVPW